MKPGGRKRVAVLVSGRGANMTALIKAAKAPDYPAEIVLVISNRPEALAIGVARNAGVPVIVIDHTTFPNREAHEAAIGAALDQAKPDIVCLAGYMRIFTPAFVRRYSGRLINIHPSLLPAFRGTNTHARALAAGAPVHGASVHFVTDDVDEGPIIAQAEVPVLPGDNEETLAARVLEAELRLYPRALAMVATGQVKMPDPQVIRR